MEVAGVVLAMLPLLIKGLTGAARAAETFDTLRRSSRELDRYGRKLKRELTIYQTTLVELLEGIVKSDDELQEMMLDTESHLWIRYDAAVRQRLGHRYESFVETVEEIEDELQELVNRLDLKTVSSTTLEVSGNFRSSTHLPKRQVRGPWRRCDVKISL